MLTVCWFWTASFALYLGASGPHLACTTHTFSCCEETHSQMKAGALVMVPLTLCNKEPSELAFQNLNTEQCPFLRLCAVWLFFFSVMIPWSILPWSGGGNMTKFVKLWIVSCPIFLGWFYQMTHKACHISAHIHRTLCLVFLAIFT